MARQAIALAPGNAAINDTLGWILVETGKPGEALGYLREASAREYGNPRFRYHLAVCLNELGRSAEARRELLVALEQGRRFDDRTAAEQLLAALQKEDV